MKKTERPREVTIVAVLYGISAAVLLIEAYKAILDSPLEVGVSLAFAALAAAIVWGLLEMASWARYTALSVGILFFILEATVVWRGMMNGELSTVIQSLINMSVNAWIIYSLLQPRVAAAFRRPAYSLDWNAARKSCIKECCVLRADAGCVLSQLAPPGANEEHHVHHHRAYERP